LYLYPPAVHCPREEAPRDIPRLPKSFAPWAENKISKQLKYLPNEYLKVQNWPTHSNWARTEWTLMIDYFWSFNEASIHESKEWNPLATDMWHEVSPRDGWCLRSVLKSHRALRCRLCENYRSVTYWAFDRWLSGSSDCLRPRSQITKIGRDCFSDLETGEVILQAADQNFRPVRYGRHAAELSWTILSKALPAHIHLHLRICWQPVYDLCISEWSTYLESPARNARRVKDLKIRVEMFVIFFSSVWHAETSSA
jgi:hypothetical protein